MTIDDLRKKKLIIFECISGSKAYGLDTASSDTDIKGIYILPEDDYFGLDYIPQINNETNDIVFYEIKRFVELLYKNNPNLLEMLNTDNRHIIYKNKLCDLLKPELFISKLCKDTFAGYAMTQIRKARGLNKKILNPLPEKRKTVLDYCYVIKGQNSVPLSKWLDENEYQQKNCGLINIAHMKNMYSVFYSKGNTANYQGIIRKEKANDVALTSIPKEEKPVASMYFNKEGYSSYCKKYKEYWEWVNNRNEARYKNTLQHGKNYDAKNMMHTFRLLDMAAEILETGKINVIRQNREELLKIKTGQFEYDYLIEKAKEKLNNIEKLYLSSNLPKKPDKSAINRILIKIRKEFYLQNN